MKQYVRRTGAQAERGTGATSAQPKRDGRPTGDTQTNAHLLGKRPANTPRVRAKSPAGNAGKDEVKKCVLITIRTVIGQEVPDVDHLPGELVITMSPEHYSMFRDRAKKAGKSMEAYFKQDMFGLPAKPVGPDAPVPYEIVGAPTAPPAPNSERFLMASVAATYPANRRNSMLERIEKAMAKADVQFMDFMRHVIHKGLVEIEDTGEFRARAYLPDIVFTKLHARLAEIDRVFEFSREDGFTQWIMAQAMEDLLKGKDDVLFGGYTFDNPKKAHRDYRAMIGRWRKEDGLPPLKLPPWRAQRVQKTERRAA